MIKDNEEYQEFLTWAMNGSTLAQRMQSPFEQVVIPEHWEQLKPYADKLPPTFEEFLAGPNE